MKPLSQELNIATNLSALILAAGKSQRMGKDKASLLLNSGETFALHLVEQYTRLGCSPLLMVVNNAADLSRIDPGKVKFILNQNLEKGRSWSVMLGLKQIPAGHACFIQNVDNPITDPALLWQMCDALSPEKYIVPTFGGKGGHPVLLGSRVVEELRKKDIIINLREELENYPRVEIPARDGTIHLNINTPEDFAMFIKLRCTVAAGDRDQPAGQTDRCQEPGDNQQ